MTGEAAVSGAGTNQVIINVPISALGGTGKTNMFVAISGKGGGSGTTTTYSGSISFSGTFDGNWSNFESQNPLVQCGNSYSYNQTAGGTILVTFNCSGAPPFVPIPVSGGGPSGPVTFDAQ